MAQTKTTFIFCALLALTTFKSYADDTEIFFSQSASNNAAQANVLFVLDTSSSMTNIVPNTDKTRLQTMKDALNEILKDVSGVNVGLMRFHEKGGPILFPVSNIDAPITDIEEYTPNLTYKVTSDSDSVEERSDGTMYLDSSDLELGSDNGDKQLVGIRFNDIVIPKDTEITAAYLEFTVDEANEQATEVTIQGILSANAAAFTSNNKDLSSRAKTVKSSLWSIPAWASVGATKRSPDISTIVSEIIGHSDWKVGNSMSFVLSGTGERTAESYKDSPSQAPKLILEVADSSLLPTPQVRNKLMSVVNEIEYKTGTPINSTLYEAAKYFRGEEVHYGKQRGDQGSRSELSRISHPKSYTLANGASVRRDTNCTDEDITNIACRTEIIDGNATYNSPAEYACQTNHIVLLSDGSPSRSHAVSNIESLINKSCSGSGNEKCGRELVSFLNTTDQRANLDGLQNIVTHTIGFNFAGSQYLSDLATLGGGKFFEASTASELAAVFRAILTDVADDSSSFATPTVSVNQQNKFAHDNSIFLSQFIPAKNAGWIGNVKKYQINDGEIADVSGNPIVNSSTGMIKDSAKSFWLAEDAGPDGNQVGLGGVATKLSSNLNRYTYIASADTANGLLTSAEHALSEANENITNDMLGLATGQDVNRTLLLKWAKGIAVPLISDLPISSLLSLDLNSYSSPRTSVGDSLHSKPLLISQRDESGNNLDTLFYATNEGFLHAVDASTGVELFAFMPKELLPNLAKLRDSGLDEHVYGIDGPITSWIYDQNNNGVMDEGDHTHIYVGMRRGGSAYIALDVTNRAAPKFLWQIDNTQSDFSELGQTWSKALKSRTMINGEIKDVVVFSGGYDTNQDSNDLPTNDSKGRAIYMVDALSGKRLWWAGHGSSGADLSINALNNSIPADPQLLDINRDGMFDIIYAADTRAQILRIDINKANTGKSNYAQGAIIAKFSGTTKSENRRFYVTPDITYVKDPSKTFGAVHFFNISIGSGYRAHPLNLEIKDRFYSFRDINVFSIPDTNKDGIADYPYYTENNLLDVTSIVLDESDPNSLTNLHSQLSAKQGWMITLDNVSGQKVLAESTTVNNHLLFNAYQPGTTSACQANIGESRLYIVDLGTGLPVKKYNERTGIRIPGGGIAPEPVPYVGSTPNSGEIFIGKLSLTKILGQSFDVGEMYRKTYWRQE